MKHILVLLFLVLALPSVVRADLEGAPFVPESDARFNALEQGNHINTNCGSGAIGSCDGHWVKQYVLATYNVSVLGGSYTTNSGVYDLGVSIPAKAIIVNTLLYTTYQPITSASGTLGFYCQNTGDIINQTAATSFAAAGSVIPGAAYPSPWPNTKFITTKCNIHAKVATGALTAGNVTAIVEYIVHR